MRSAIAFLLAVAACNGSAPAPVADADVPAGPRPNAQIPAKAESEPTPTPETEDVDEDPPAPTRMIPSVEDSSARAIVVRDGELRRFAPSGRSELVAAVPGMLACDVDDEHGVVWLASARDLAVYDLADSTVHPVTKGVVAGYADLIWRVQVADATSPRIVAGNANELEHCVALVVELGPTPSVRAQVVAQGEREADCLADDGMGGTIAGKLDDEASARKKGYGRAKLADAKYLVALASRSAGAPTKPEEPAPPPAPRPRVDVDRCTEEAEACGRAEYVGGERLWWVVVGNSRGDYFHEQRMLYDTKTRRWWDPIADTRPAKPGDGSEGLVLHISPDRSWGLVEGRILSLVDAETIASWSGSFCGWQR